MSYQAMDHAGWIQQHIDAQRRNGHKMHPSTPVVLNDFQKKVMDILGIIGNGIYNAPINPDKIDWDFGRGISVVWQQKEFATYDWHALTLLVFLCHEGRIRCSLSACGPRNLRLSFWQRKAEGGYSERHPGLDEAVARFRAYLPSDHRIIFKETPADQPLETVTTGQGPG